MGNKKSKQKVEPSLTPTKPKHKIHLSKILELSFFVQTPPILKNNEVILLYSNNETKKTKYSILNLKDKKLTTDAANIKCHPEFDVFNTVYALHEKQNKVYFIEDNKNILSWNLNENEIISLDESITTTHNNYATIIYMNDELYVLGAESVENRSSENNNYFVIPYSTARSSNPNRKYVQTLTNAGKFSRVINVKFNELNCILIIGGQRDMNPYPRPQDSILRYLILSHSQSIVLKCINSFAKYCITIPMSIISVIYDFYCIRDYDQVEFETDSLNQKPLSIRERRRWTVYHLPLHMNSNGIINYENRYLFLFGGNGIERTDRKGRKKANCIFALPLKHDDEYNLRQGEWYELTRKLSKKDNFHAVYNGDDIVHLFSYSGIYYTMSIHSILDVLKMGLVSGHAYEDGVICQYSWTETSNSVFSSKSNHSVQNMGVK